MKTVLFILCHLALFVHLSAQVTSGEIIYEIKQDMHRDLPPEAEMYKSKIPEFRTFKNKLLFTQKETLYTRIKEEPKDVPEETGRRRFSRRGPGSSHMENKIYVDLASNETIEEKSLLGKKFLIEGAQPPIKWKMTAEQKQVGAFLCQKAIYQDSTQLTEVWFSPMIPVPSGPAEFRNLPGMVLHVDIDEGHRTMTAIDIISRPIEADELTKPTEGEEITVEEFEKIREEKMEERKSRMGRRGPRRF